MSKELRELETPYFLIHEGKIDTMLESMFQSFHKYWENGIVAYTCKTFALPYLAEIMKARGGYVEVFSSGEFNLALNMGVPYEKIIFNGPVKGKEEFLEAASHKTVINIDSMREIEWLKECGDVQAEIGLRVNFDMETACPDETYCANEDGRFGFSYEVGDLEEALNALKETGVTLSGLYLNCNSKTRSVNIYQAIAEMIVRIADQYELNPAYIDIGGGFISNGDGLPAFDEYFSSVKAILDESERLQNANMIIEPGMTLIGSAVDYVTSVLETKEMLHNTFIQTDGSRVHIDPLFIVNPFTYRIDHVNPSTCRELVVKQTICGFTNMENDRFLSIDNYRPIDVGDTITFERAGAFLMGLSSMFVQFFPEIYKEKDGEIVSVKDRKVVKRNK